MYFSVRLPQSREYHLIENGNEEETERMRINGCFLLQTQVQRLSTLTPLLKCISETHFKPLRR